MHTFDNMGLANQVAVLPQFLSDMVRHIEQELKDTFAQPHWISEVTSNRDGCRLHSTLSELLLSKYS